jgi:hypothetical protein
MKKSNENLQKYHNLFKDAAGGPSIENNVSKLLNLFTKAKAAQKVEEMDAIASVLASIAAGVMLVGGKNKKSRRNFSKSHFKTKRNKN